MKRGETRGPEGRGLSKYLSKWSGGIRQYDTKKDHIGGDPQGGGEKVRKKGVCAFLLWGDWEHLPQD